MSDPGEPDERPFRPTWRERLRPAELLGISGVLAGFAFLVVALVTRGDWLLAVVVGGVAFVVALVVLAMLALGTKDPGRPPSDREG